MFNINSKKQYTVTFIKGGEGAKGGYTFISVQDEVKQGQKYPERLQINVWGENLEDRIKKGAKISIAGATDVGLVAQQDKNDQNKWYQHLTISCSPDSIIVSDLQENKNEAQQIDDGGMDLPF